MVDDDQLSWVMISAIAGDYACKHEVEIEITSDLILIADTDSDYPGCSLLAYVAPSRLKLRNERLASFGIPTGMS